MGGDRRPGPAGSRQRHARRRPQPPEPRSRRPRHEDQEADGVLRRRRLARRRGEVRVAAAARPSPGPAARRCATTSTRCRTRHTSRCSPSTAASCATGSSTGADAGRAGARSPTSPTTSSAPLVQNLGGHDLGLLLDAYRACDEVHRPAERRVRLHGQGMGAADRRRPAQPRRPPHRRRRSTSCGRSVGLTPDDEWDRFDPDSAAGRLCAAVGGELNNRPAPPRPALPCPAAVGVAGRRPTSTQEAFGRVLDRLGRRRRRSAERIVTTSPDVSVSTNLGGWINKVGVFPPAERPTTSARSRLLRWKQSPTGRTSSSGSAR